MIYTKNYKKLIKIIPNIKEMKAGDYLKLKSEGFMDLSIDILKSDENVIIFSMAHNFIQNGDVMADPDMEIRLFKQADAIEALTFQNSALGIYQEVYCVVDGNKKVRAKLKMELNRFLRTWLINLKNQGFKRIEPIEEK